MPLEYNEKLLRISQNLRKNMTPEEKRLWYEFFKLLPITVNRQKMIADYVVDFYIHSANIVIEIDGIQHETRKNKASDEIRDSKLTSLGITVLRYSNTSIRDDFNYVCDDILKHLNLTFQDVKRTHFKVK